jgi:hypothetical protein
LRGYPLPPPGSFQERIVTTLSAREVNEKVAFARLLVQACTLGRGVSSDTVDDILEEYREEASQDRYNYGYVTLRQRRLRERVRKAEETARMMARLDQMTVTDDRPK